MVNIFIKELKLFIKKPLGLVFIGVFFLAASAVFVTNMLMGVTDIRNLFSQYSGFLWFLIPILSVGLLNYEKKNSTDRLLFTSPLSTLSIVLGKYLASLAIFLVAILTTFFFTPVFIAHSKPGFMLVLNSYFALFMYGSAILAMGLFFGSLLKSSAGGLLATSGLLIFSSQLGLLKSIENLPEWLGKIMDLFFINGKYNLFFEDLVSPEAFVYFLSLAVIFVFLSCITADKRSSN